ncbi:MAG: caspase family protein [Bacteroidota bacterium]
MRRLLSAALLLVLAACEGTQTRTLTERRNVRTVERVAEDAQASVRPVMAAHFNAVTGAMTVGVVKEVAGELRRYDIYDEAEITVKEKQPDLVHDVISLPFAVALAPLDASARRELPTLFQSRELERKEKVATGRIGVEGAPLGKQGVTRQPWPGLTVFLSIEEAPPRQKANDADGEAVFDLYDAIDTAAQLLDRESLSLRLWTEAGGKKVETPVILAGADFAALRRLTASYAAEKGRQARSGGDHPQAAKRFRLAAELGEPEAQYLLAEMYRDGQGVPQNHQDARHWTERAARQGHAPAQLALAEDKGEPLAEAYVWASLAASQLRDDPRRRAVTLRDALAARLKGDDLRGAQAQAARFAAVPEMRDESLAALAAQAEPPPPLDATRLKGKPQPTAVALVIGVEDYLTLPMAQFAGRDARAFGEFATNALGVAPARVKVLTGSEARLLDIEKAIDTWLKAEIQSGATDVYVYFAGHGLASPDGRELYMIPHDGDRAILKRSAIDRDRLIASILGHGASNVTLFLDTCYSGGTRGGTTLIADARPLMIVPKDQGLPPAANLLAAAGNDQLSSSYGAARHGLYSYFLMRGLMGDADADGDRVLTLAELSTFVQRNTRREAARLGRDQSPVLVGDGEKVVMRW